MSHFRRVYAKINLNAILHNMEQMKNNLKPGTKMLAVVKTDGYGHGSIPVAKLLQDKEYMFGFGVATVDEAIDLRNAGITLPILILGYTFPDGFDSLAKENIRPALFREDNLPLLSEAAMRQGKDIKVHIKVDTGMGRLGIRPDDSGIDFIRKVIDTKGIEIEGLFTHFARADEIDKTWANRQLTIFKEFAGRIEKELGIKIPVKHCSNSAGVLDIQDANMDIVRPGITVYGLSPSDEIQNDTIKLEPALSLYSHVVFIKEVEAGMPISYGGTYVTDKKMRIATIPVGYGDGYPRSLSNIGYVLIRGKKAPILGRVCMDQFMVDITNIPDAKEDDLVTLVGTDGGEKITAEMIGEQSGRFNYEFVCDLGKRIPRVYEYVDVEK